MNRLRNLYRLTFHPSPQWQQLSVWQRWRFMFSRTNKRAYDRLDGYPGDFEAEMEAWIDLKMSKEDMDRTLDRMMVAAVEVREYPDPVDRALREVEAKAEPHPHYENDAQ